MMHNPASHSHHVHSHSHDVALAPSLLRLSVPQRLAVAAVAAVFLWLVVFWALQEIAS